MSVGADARSRDGGHRESGCGGGEGVDDVSDGAVCQVCGGRGLPYVTHEGMVLRRPAFKPGIKVLARKAGG